MSVAVVKLGGSSVASASLADWLAAIEASTQRLILVPGGGPFADAVRDSQHALGFSDKSAHAMALLAMEQFGHVLVDKTSRLHPACSKRQIDVALADGKIPVWFPSAMALADTTIPASWDITSDSLAAWLAGELNASALLLIKQTDDFSTADTGETLAARGITDPAFPAFMPPGIPVYVAGPRHLRDAAISFAKGQLPGECIVPANRVRRTG